MKKRFSFAVETSKANGLLMASSAPLMDRHLLIYGRRRKKQMHIIDLRQGSMINHSLQPHTNTIMGAVRGGGAGREQGWGSTGVGHPLPMAGPLGWPSFTILDVPPCEPGQEGSSEQRHPAHHQE